MSQSILGLRSCDPMLGLLGIMKSELQLWRNKTQAHPTAFIKASQKSALNQSAVHTAREVLSSLCSCYWAVYWSLSSPSPRRRAWTRFKKPCIFFFLFYFCKEPHSLMAFKTGSTTIKLKSENAHCRHPLILEAVSLSLSHVLCLYGMHAQMLIHMHTDRLTFIHFTPCLEWLLYGIQIHWRETKPLSLAVNSYVSNISKGLSDSSSVVRNFQNFV